MIELPVDQGEALGDKPHMRNGGLGGARCDRDGRRPQSPAQHRGVDPADAVLCQQFGERRLTHALRRRDVVVNRIEQLRVVAPELRAHPVWCNKAAEVGESAKQGRCEWLLPQ